MIHVIGMGTLFTNWLNIEGKLRNCVAAMPCHSLMMLRYRIVGGILSKNVGGDNRVVANVILMGLMGLGLTGLMNNVCLSFQASG